MPHAVVYEYADIEQFFRSCALALCMQRSLEVNWVPYKDSRVLNTLYGMKSVLWGAVGKEAAGPGAVEVTMASRQELADEIEQKTNDFVQVWLKKLHEHGPDAAHAYVDRIGGLRNSAIQTIQDTFREVGQINAEIAGQLGQAVKRCAQIKLGATVGVAVLSGGAGVLLAGGATGATAVGLGMTLGGGTLGPGLSLMAVGLSHNMGMSIAKNYEGGHAAKAVGIDMSKSAGKALAGEAMGQMASKTAQSAGEAVARESLARQNAAVTIKRYTNLLARKSATAKQKLKHSRNLSAAEAKAAEAARNASAARATRTKAKFMGKAVPVVFAAWDILDAVVDYREDVKGL